MYGKAVASHRIASSQAKILESNTTLPDLVLEIVPPGWSPAQVEEECPLEPTEVEELRCANDYPPSVFEGVLDSVRRAFPSGRWDEHGEGNDNPYVY